MVLQSNRRLLELQENLIREKQQTVAKAAYERAVTAYEKVLAESVAD